MIKLRRRYLCPLCNNETVIWIIQFRRGPLCWHRGTRWANYAPSVTREELW